MFLIRASVLSIMLVPALTLFAAEKDYPGTTKSNPPPVTVSGLYLIDKSIPAYGAVNQVPHFTESRANALYLEIHQVLADVEVEAMTGAVASVIDEAKNKKKDQPIVAVGDARLLDLVKRLTELEAKISYRTYLEQWHIDTSYADLARAAEMMTFSGRIGAETPQKIHESKPKAQPAVEPAAVQKVVKPAASVVVPKAPAVVPKAPAAVIPEVPAVEVPAAPEAPAVEVPAAPEAPAVEVPAASEAAAVEVPAASEAAAVPEATEGPAAEAPELTPAEPPAEQ